MKNGGSHLGDATRQVKSRSIKEGPFFVQVCLAAAIRMYRPGVGLIGCCAPWQVQAAVDLTITEEK